MFLKKDSMILSLILCFSSLGLLNVDVSKNHSSWALSSSDGLLEKDVPTNNNSITIGKHDDDGILEMIKWNASTKEQSSVSAIISNSKEQETISGVYNATTNNLTYADYLSKYFRDIKAKSRNNQTIVKSGYQYLPYTSTGLLKSGGPLFSFHSEYDERMQETLYYNYVIGINSTCEPDTAENAYYLYAGITKITNTMIDFIRGLK